MKFATNGIVGNKSFASKLKVLNSKGQEVTLDKKEQLNADYNQTICNGLGYDISITALSTIIKKESEQKFFEIAPADYLPVVVGNGAWSSNLVTYRSFSLGASFEDGVVNMGGNNTRLAAADVGVDAITVPVFNWAKTISWSIMELEVAAKAGNWDLITSKAKSRLKNWQLGIQRIAFLGLNNPQNGGCLGLLNQPNVNTNTTVITSPVGLLGVAQLKTFCATLIEAYRKNCNRTAWPTHLIMPESDYNACASQASADFPIKSVLQILTETFQTVTRNNGFKILPLAYGDAAYNGLGNQIYCLLNYDDESIRMDIPVDYTSTQANSIDNFMFQNVAYGQFTGVMAYRPLEMLYFTYPNPGPY